MSTAKLFLVDKEENDEGGVASRTIKLSGSGPGHPEGGVITVDVTATLTSEEFMKLPSAGSEIAVTIPLLP